jgi:hypothetical protein
VRAAHLGDLRAGDSPRSRLSRVSGSRRLLFLCLFHPTSVRNGCGPDSKPVSRGFDSFHRCFSGIHEYRLEQLTTGHSSHFLPGRGRSGRPSLRRRPCAGEDTRARPGQPSPGPATPWGRHQLSASGQATSFGMRTSGVRVPPAGPGARRMLATGRAGATDVPCDGNPHHIRRRAPDARCSTGESACLRSRRVQVQVLPGVLCPKRKWAMRRDVDPEEAGSSPAGHPQVRRPAAVPVYHAGRRLSVVRDAG